MEFYEFLAAYSTHRELSELGYHIYYTTQLRDLSRKLCVHLLLGEQISMSEYYRQAVEMIGMSNLIKYERLWEKAGSYEHYKSRNGDIHHVVMCAAEEIPRVNQNYGPGTKANIVSKVLNREVVEFDIVDFTLNNQCKRDSWDWRYNYIKHDMLLIDDLSDDDYEKAVSEINDEVIMEGGDDISYELYFRVKDIIHYDDVPKLLQSLNKQYLTKLIELCSGHDIYNCYRSRPDAVPVDNIPDWLMLIVDDNHMLKNDYTGFFYYYNTSDHRCNYAISREILHKGTMLLRLNHRLNIENDDAADTLRRLYDAVGHRAYVSMFIYYEYATEYLGYGQIYVEAIHKLCHNDTFVNHIDAAFMEELTYLEQVSSLFDREYYYDYDCAIFCKDTRPRLDVLYTPDNTRLIYDCLREMDMDDAIPVLLPQCCWMIHERA